MFMLFEPDWAAIGQKVMAHESAWQLWNMVLLWGWIRLSGHPVHETYSGSTRAILVSTSRTIKSDGVTRQDSTPKAKAKWRLPIICSGSRRIRKAVWHWRDLAQKEYRFRPWSLPAPLPTRGCKFSRPHRGLCWRGCGLCAPCRRRRRRVRRQFPRLPLQQRRPWWTRLLLVND